MGRARHGRGPCRSYTGNSGRHVHGRCLSRTDGRRLRAGGRTRRARGALDDGDNERRAKYEARWKTVKVDVENGIGWITLNRPEKRNAMSPTLNREMIDVLETLTTAPDDGGAA